MRRARVWTGIAAALLVLAGACSSSDGSTATPIDAPPCPTGADRRRRHRRPVGRHRPVASPGSCADVTTIIKGADVDPHEFEPTPPTTPGSSMPTWWWRTASATTSGRTRSSTPLSPRPAARRRRRGGRARRRRQPARLVRPRRPCSEVAAAVTAELGTLLPDAARVPRPSGPTAWDERPDSPTCDEVAAAEGRRRRADLRRHRVRVRRHGRRGRARRPHARGLPQRRGQRDRPVARRRARLRGGAPAAARSTS